jgi:hypothetical protein
MPLEGARAFERFYFCRMKFAARRVKTPGGFIF